MNKRREAREFCFQYFFHLQLPVFAQIRHSFTTGASEQEIINSINEFKETTNTMLSDELNKFVYTIISGTLAHYDELQVIIEKHIKNWKLPRISRVDHTNLLLSTYELCFDKSTPTTIVINEAIEISKKFGSLESGSFINGVLDSIADSQKED